MYCEAKKCVHICITICATEYTKTSIQQKTSVYFAGLSGRGKFLHTQDLPVTRKQDVRLQNAHIKKEKINLKRFLR